MFVKLKNREWIVKIAELSNVLGPGFTFLDIHGEIKWTQFSHIERVATEKEYNEQYKDKFNLDSVSVKELTDEGFLTPVKLSNKKELLTIEKALELNYLPAETPAGVALEWVNKWNEMTASFHRDCESIMADTMDKIRKLLKNKAK